MYILLDLLPNDMIDLCLQFILEVPNLYMIETIGTKKLAKSLHTSWMKLAKEEPLKIMLQVNTSGEPRMYTC